MFGQRRILFIRRGPSEKVHPDANYNSNITPTCKHAGGSGMGVFFILGSTGIKGLSYTESKEP